MNWYDVLKAVRRIGKEQFAASDLATKTGLKPEVASAWLGKFCRWGYVVRKGAETSAGKRWKRLYGITEWGERYDPKFSTQKRRKSDEE